jgi:hypothetical protein
VRRLDLHRRALATIAEAKVDGWNAGTPMLTACSREEVERLLNWMRSGEVRQGSAESDPLLALLAAKGTDVDVIAGPITDPRRGRSARS